MCRIAFLLCTVLALHAFAKTGEVGLNVYGLSYHLDRAHARELRLDNELNRGLGVRYRVLRSERLDWIFDAGAYYDSGRNTAVVAGAGALWKTSSERLRLGAALVFFDTQSLNRGHSFLAPLPLATYELDRATLNLVYLPKFRELNPVPAFGFWVTFWLGR
jgi:hypothetical protein